MIVVTTEEVAGKTVKKHLGLVRGNTIRARHIGHDIMALLRNIVGGEIRDYTKMMAEAREQAKAEKKDKKEVTNGAPQAEK